MRTFTLCLFLCLFGCQSTSRNEPPMVKGGLLAYVPESGQKSIEQARHRRGELNEQLAAAHRDRAEAESHLELSRANLKALRLKVSEARDRAKHARRFGSNSEFDAAQTNRDEVEAAVRLADARLAYYEVLRDLADRRIDLLGARVTLADARFELAKARAVSGLDRPVAEQVDVDDHRHAVEHFADEVERARIEALVARERVRLRSTFAESCVDGVPEGLQFGRIEPMASLFRSDAYDSQQDRLDEREMAPARRSDAAAANADVEKS